MTRKHQCRHCKRLVPLAPRTAMGSDFTVGVAHVVREPEGLAEPCVPMRTYSRAEQRHNLENTDWEAL